MKFHLKSDVLQSSGCHMCPACLGLSAVRQGPEDFSPPSDSPGRDPAARRSGPGNRICDLVGGAWTECPTRRAACGLAPQGTPAARAASTGAPTVTRLRQAAARSERGSRPPRTRQRAAPSGRSAYCLTRLRAASHSGYTRGDSRSPCTVTADDSRSPALPPASLGLSCQLY